MAYRGEKVTKIKICGVRREEDIVFMNDIKPDFAGFVFAESKRSVTLKEASGLADLLRPEIIRVGVFVNQPIETIVTLLQQHVIQMVQLHGQEDEAYRQALLNKLDQKYFKKKFLIKAVQVKTQEDIVNAEKESWDYLLLDAGNGETAGGNGITFDWDLARTTKKFFLAGGLNAKNVGSAIKQVRPWAVDVSSGVESDGVKDYLKMREFVQKVKECDKEIEKRSML